MKNNWQKKRLGDVVSITTGHKDANAHVFDGAYPFFTCSQDISKIDKYTFDCEAVLVAGNGDFNVKYYKGKFDAYQRTYVIQGLGSLSNIYLYYLLQNDLSSITDNARGSTVKYLKLGDFTNHVTIIPNIKTQNRIVDILSSVDGAIHKTDQTIQKTEKLKNGLMNELLTKGIGHRRFIKTKFGEIPKEWELGELKTRIKSLNAGVSVNSHDRLKQQSEIGILKTSAVTLGVFDSTQHKTVKEDEKFRVMVPVKANRIIVSRMNTIDLVGANAYIAQNFSDLFLPDRLWQVEPFDDRKISMLWLSYLLNSLWKNGNFAHLATGTSASMKNLSKEKILSMLVAFPSVNEQEKVAKILSVVDEEITANQKIKSKLVQIKKGLMQDIFSQKLNIN